MAGTDLSAPDGHRPNARRMSLTAMRGILGISLLLLTPLALPFVWIAHCLKKAP